MNGLIGFRRTVFSEFGEHLGGDAAALRPRAEGSTEKQKREKKFVHDIEN